MSKVVVLGGGAAGMMAAIAAAQQGHAVTLFEKNEKLGKKIYITGKGRCNLTNNCDVEELLQAVCTNRKFLYSAFYGFTSQDTIAFFEQAGVRTKTERGNRVFPVSDHASDVIGALSSQMRRYGVDVHLNTAVQALELRMADGSEKTVPCDQDAAQMAEDPETASASVKGVRLSGGRVVPADCVIAATGGFSYRTTGSTGVGYRLARNSGHTVTELSPSLVPIETAEEYARQMQGLSLRNVEITICDGKKELYRAFGEMMFTHFGVTGPLILTASTAVQKRLREHPLQMYINLKPALTEEQLDARILREFDAAKNKQFKNVIGSLYPSKLIPVMLELSQIPPDKPVHEISKEERQTLEGLTRRFPLTLTRLRDYNEAIITRGGVSVREINPSTMESKRISGLYFAGEILDLDAVTGGFNLQIAWATGHAAGMGIH
jgi:predicted flavoprotein YhiN